MRLWGRFSKAYAILCNYRKRWDSIVLTLHNLFYQVLIVVLRAGPKFFVEYGVGKKRASQVVQDILTAGTLSYTGS